jgi:hypothetical protein
MGLFRDGLLGKKHGGVEVHKANNRFAAQNIRDQLRVQGYGSIKIKEEKSYLVSGRPPLKRKGKQ